MLKVHITFTPEVGEDAARLAAVRAQIEGVTPLLDVNERRFEKHGVLTAHIVGRAQIPAIEAIPGVLAVEPDEERRAL